MQILCNLCMSSATKYRKGEIPVIGSEIFDFFHLNMLIIFHVINPEKFK